MIERRGEGRQDGSRTFFAFKLFGADSAEIVVGESNVEQANQEPEGLAALSFVQRAESTVEEVLVVFGGRDGRRVGNILNQF